MNILATVSPIEILLAFVVYVGSFVAIPVLAKAFAGALNKLTGLVSDKSRGIFDRTRNRANKWAQDKKEGIAARKQTSRALRRKEQESDPSWWNKVSARRGLAGGSWRHSKAGQTGQKKRKTKVGRALQRRLDSRREIADTAFTKGERRAYGELVEEGQTELQGSNFKELRAVAEDSNAQLHRRQAAFTSLVKAGAITDVREFIERSQRVSPEEDKNLHQTIFNTVRSGAFYDEKIAEKAPDLALIGRDLEAKNESGAPVIKVQAPSDEGMLRTIGQAKTANDIFKFDPSTLRVSLGLEPREVEGETIDFSGGSNEMKELREIMVEKARNLMDPENKFARDNMPPQHRKLFKKVLEDAPEDDSKRSYHDSADPRTWM